LLAGEDQTLLVGGNSFLVLRAGGQLWGGKIYDPNFEHTLNLALDIVDGVGRLNLKGDGLTREGLDEDLHVQRSGITKTTSQFLTL
jgi:hypothetical protein